MSEEPSTPSFFRSVYESVVKPEPEPEPKKQEPEPEPEKEEPKSEDFDFFATMMRWDRVVREQWAEMRQLEFDRKREVAKMNRVKNKGRRLQKRLAQRRETPGYTRFLENK